MKKRIPINVCGIELTAEVEFKFYPGCLAQTSGPVGGWAEEEPDEFEFTKLTAGDDDWDITSLLGIDEVRDAIEEILVNTS